MADAQPQIDVLLGQVDLPVGQEEPERDLRVLGKEVEGHGQKVPAAEHLRSGDVQLAPGRAVLAHRGTLRLLNLFHNALARGDVSPPRISELDAPTGADEEVLGAQVLLQICHLAADGSEGRPKPSRRGGQASLLHHSEEHGHGVEAVYQAFRIVGGTIPKS